MIRAFIRLLVLIGVLAVGSPAVAEPIDPTELFPSWSGEQAASSQAQAGPDATQAGVRPTEETGPNIAAAITMGSISLVSLAGGLILDGVIIDGFPESASNYEIDALDWVPVVLYFISAGTGLGAIFQLVG